jgi:hypothetical protein
MESTLKPENIIGEYSLKGVPEMAAGFKFNGDFSFQFFYIYGASDRRAEGKFEISDNKIILHGNKKVGNDFNILNKSILDKGYSIKITCENELFIRNVVCFFYGQGEPVVLETNNEGIASVEISKCSKIELIHSYFPDLPTVIDLSNNDYNYFELSLNPSLEEVVFDNQELEFDGNTFQCSNIYLFGQNLVKFVKQ